MASADESAALEAELQSAITQPTPQEPSPPAEPEPTEETVETPSSPEPEAAEQPDEAPETDGNDTFLRLLKEQGHDLSSQYKSDKDVAQALIHLRSKVGQKDEFAQLGKAIRENPQAFFQQYAPKFGYIPQSAVPQVPSQPPEEVTREKLLQWQSAVERDENGNIVGTKAGHDPAIASRLREFEQRAIQTQQEFLLNPKKFLQQYIQENAEQFRQTVAEEMEARQSLARQEQEAVEFFEQNKHWLVDATTQSLTPNGQKFQEYLDLGQQLGIDPRNTQGLAQFALVRLEADALRAQHSRPNQPPPATPKPTRKANVSSPPPAQDIGQYEEGEDLERALLRNLGLGVG